MNQQWNAEVSSSTNLSPGTATLSRITPTTSPSQNHGQSFRRTSHGLSTPTSPSDPANPTSATASLAGLISSNPRSPITGLEAGFGASTVRRCGARFVKAGGRVRMHPDKIRTSIGGERLEAVMGRGEDEELPVFESGAFDVEVVDRSSHGRKLVDDEFLNQYVQFGVDSQHTMRGLVDSVKLVGASDFQCSEI
ncbi:unnamed protein product [Camellia sinensis]